ncbi:Adaptor for signal transduction, partial [Cladochytrium tenue]
DFVDHRKPGFKADTLGRDNNLQPNQADSQASYPKDRQDVFGTIKVAVAVDTKDSELTFKSYKVSTADTCGKLLLALLRKFAIKDNPVNFVWVVRFSGEERELSLDECPLNLVLSMKDGNLVPVFLLRRKRGAKNRKAQRSATSAKTAGGPATELSGPNAFVIQDFLPQNDVELRLSVGDRVVILNQEADWYFVQRSGSADSGWVPVQCLADDLDYLVSEQRRPLPFKGVVLYNYNAGSPSEATVKKGDVVDVSRWRDLWLLVELPDQKGWVPRSYVSIMKSEVIDNKTTCLYLSLALSHQNTDGP